MNRRPTPRHAPTKMTRSYNQTIAFSKVATAPLDKLSDAMIESIARTHKVPVAELQQQLAERRVREAACG